MAPLGAIASEQKKKLDVLFGVLFLCAKHHDSAGDRDETGGRGYKLPGFSMGISELFDGCGVDSTEQGDGEMGKNHCWKSEDDEGCRKFWVGYGLRTEQRNGDSPGDEEECHQEHSGKAWVPYPKRAPCGFCPDSAGNHCKSGEEEADFACRDGDGGRPFFGAGQADAHGDAEDEEEVASGCGGDVEGQNRDSGDEHGGNGDASEQNEQFSEFGFRHILWIEVLK